jgi:hypothetical protein
MGGGFLISAPLIRHFPFGFTCERARVLINGQNEAVYMYVVCICRETRRRLLDRYYIYGIAQQRTRKKAKWSIDGGVCRWEMRQLITRRSSSRCNANHVYYITPAPLPTIYRSKKYTSIYLIIDLSIEIFFFLFIRFKREKTFESIQLFRCV